MAYGVIHVSPKTNGDPLSIAAAHVTYITYREGAAYIGLVSGKELRIESPEEDYEKLKRGWSDMVSNG